MREERSSTSNSMEAIENKQPMMFIDDRGFGILVDQPTILSLKSAGETKMTEMS